MKKYTKIIFTFLLLFLLPLLLLKGSAAGEGVRQGLNLAYRTVLPSLFPAMVISGIIGELSEYIPLPTAWTVWITSHLCGFPLGIRTLTRTYQRGLLTKEQTIRLSACSANASPAFLILYAGEKILGSFRAGLLLYFSQLLISFMIGLLNGSFKVKPTPLPEEKSLIFAIVNGFSGAAVGSVTLTGYITFFAMVAFILKDFPFTPYLYGFLEITGGLRGGYYLSGAMVGFSGCAVLLQNASYLSEAQLPILPMLVGKCIYTLGIPLIGIIINLF